MRAMGMNMSEGQYSVVGKIIDQRAIISEISGKDAAEFLRCGRFIRGARLLRWNDVLTFFSLTTTWEMSENCRCLKLRSEKAATVCYHFDYVGGPRNYVAEYRANRTHWEQMHELQME